MQQLETELASWKGLFSWYCRGGRQVREPDWQAGKQETEQSSAEVFCKVSQTSER